MIRNTDYVPSVSTEYLATKEAIERSGLFDAEFYAEWYPEIASSDDLLDEYLNRGWKEGRRPSIEFDAQGYLALHRDVAAAGVDPLRHYIRHGKTEGRALPNAPFDRDSLAAARERVANSGLFDKAMYLLENPRVRARQVDPILHYLVEGYKFHHEPSEAFSPQAYLAEHPETFGANPLLHHLDRQREDEENGAGRRVLKAANGSHGLPDQHVTLERMATASFFNRYGFTLDESSPTTYVPDCVAALAARTPVMTLDGEKPDVSIIIPVYGQMPFVLACLDSLARHSSRYSAEIIVADDRSPEAFETGLLATIPWIKYQLREENGGFLDNCNLSAATAKGKFIVLLNSDTRVVHGWLDNLIDSFELFPKAGFVGSKLVNADGSLQEAGAVYWHDGTAWNYGRNAASEHPKYNFARQVDWVSGASIAVPAEIWRAVDGFDVAYRPAYCEDVDLAFRIRERGYEIWYQPLSCAIHFEGMTNGKDITKGIKAYQATNLRRLQARWEGRLPGTRRGGVEPDREANRSAKQTMLVVDANIHMPDRDAGSFVATSILEIYRKMGFQLTFVPLHGFAAPQPYRANYQKTGIEVLHSPFVCSLDDALAGRSRFDYVLVFRFGVCAEILDRIRAQMPTARVIFSNVDLHYLRMQREAALTGDRSLLIEAETVKTKELAVFRLTDCSIVHTVVEKEAVTKELPGGATNLIVLPWISQIRRVDFRLKERRNIMFLGGFAHTPNVDATLYLLRDIWPKLEQILPGDVRLVIVGSDPPEAVRAFASDRVVVTGFVPEVEPYFDEAAVFVAPLRYGAGIKGKVIQSLANGVPVVATAVAAEGVGLSNGVNYIAAESANDFVRSVSDLLNDEESCHRLRDAGYELVNELFGQQRAVDICKQALDASDETWIAREQVSRRRYLQSLSLEQED